MPRFNYQAKQLSVFTIKVLQATEKIPRGKVATYAAVAKAIGAPKAARAVGNVLNKNPFAPAVPCHRVIKTDGSLGGYGFGPEKKLARLKQEGVAFDQLAKIKNPKLIIKKV